MSAEEKRGAYNKYVTILQSKAKFKAKVLICAMENSKAARKLSTLQGTRSMIMGSGRVRTLIL